MAFYFVPLVIVSEDPTQTQLDNWMPDNPKMKMIEM